MSLLPCWPAAKINAHTETMVRRAMTLGGELSHAHLVKLRGTWEDAESLCLVEEYATKGDAFQDSTNHPDKYTEEFVARDIALPLLRLLRYLHENGVVHRCVQACATKCSGTKHTTMSRERAGSGPG